MKKQAINIVWFKRDLRLQDHEPLKKAVETGLPSLLVYFFEPSVMLYPDSSERHWRFIRESLSEMNEQLGKHGHQINIIHAECLASLQRLLTVFDIHNIYSYEETGNNLTFKRDIAIADFCRENNIQWHESSTNGIIRKLKGRKDFTKRWLQTMMGEIHEVDINAVKTILLPEALLTKHTEHYPKNNFFQPGGLIAAEKYLHSFLYERKSGYNKHISKPEDSRRSCSRLSPYLTWGNLSMKQIYQAALKAKAETGDKRNLGSFINRLHWHCHFIQKFESECRMEFENLNSGFDQIRNEVTPALIKAWETGTTGYPLVDACMRCVVQTGYLNFRMRSMVVSFLTHHLWQPWQAGVHFLARQFLDYEPGIHYPQFQMQAGTMGVNTIRIYNPVKQSIEQDVDGIFIKKWVPELVHIPVPQIHQPWLMTSAEQMMYNVELGKQYPLPIVDIVDTGKYARENLWRTKGSSAVRKENQRILKLHTKRKSEKEQPLQLKF